jgi:heat shock protein 1/8
MKFWTFIVIYGPIEKPMVIVSYKGEEKWFTTEEIYSMVLTKMKEINEAHLGTTINNVHYSPCIFH